MHEESADIEAFVLELSQLLVSGVVTPKDIYDTLMEVNNNDHQAAVYCCDRAVAMAVERHTN